MRYAAIITADLVTNVVVLDDNDHLDTVASLHGATTVVDVTSVDRRPGPGWTYESGVFRPPSPFQSWVWVNGAWTAPVSRPDEGGPWVWDEDTLSWVEVNA